MKISEVLERVAAYHPNLGPDYAGCDGIKAGNPDQECTGIVSALVPTVDVIRKTAELGCNLLFVHEPTSYLTPDFPDWKADFSCHIYEEKRALLEKTGIVVYRDHDHAHAHRPDSIFTGVIRGLGWEPFYLKEDHSVPFGFVFQFPEPRTAVSLCREFMDKIGMNGISYIGRPDAEITRLALVGHIYPGAFVPEKLEHGVYDDYPTEIIRAMEEQHIDAIAPGEIVEWNVLSYIRDAASFGENKVCFRIGHFNWEQLGAEFAAEWLRDLTEGQLAVHFVPTGDIWNYQRKGE